MWLWFFSDLMKTTILSKQPLFTNAGLDSCFYGMSQNPRKNHMQRVHQTTAVYIKVFTTEQNHVRVLMDWAIMLLICRRNIKDIYRLFQSLLLWGKKKKKVLRSETLTWMKQVEMEHFTATDVAVDMQDSGNLAAARLVWRSHFKQEVTQGRVNRKWETEVLFSYSCVPIPSLA